MHYYIFLAILLSAITLAASSPIDPFRRLVNRPKDIYADRVRRSDQYVKGGFAKVPLTRVDQIPETRLRKGEYMCGNKVCMLKPGEKPPCDVCQYRV